MDYNACYGCGKPGHMMKYCMNRRSQEQCKERVQPNGPSEEAPRRQKFFSLKSSMQGKEPLVKSQVCSLNDFLMYLTVYCVYALI